MIGFHSWWTKPGGEKGLGRFELLTMVLSALKWREKNGEIVLVTDTFGADYIKTKGLDACWDRVLTDLDNIPEEIDPLRFWAAGKIYALKCFKAPVVSIDTDFIVWGDLELESCKSGVCVIHREMLNPAVYPTTTEFTDFDDGFCWDVLPANTAFVYFGNENLKNEYIRYAENFMTTCAKGDTLQPMVFAEQRLLSMVADKMKIKLDVFSSLEKLSLGEDERFTHLWGFKKSLREDEDLRQEFIKKLEKRIYTDFPHMKSII